MKIEVHGGFHNNPDGVRIGDVVDVDDTEGARYCALGYAEPVVDKREERAVPPKDEEQREETPAVKPQPRKPAQPSK